MGSISLHMAVRCDRWGLLAYIWQGRRGRRRGRSPSPPPAPGAGSSSPVWAVGEVVGQGARISQKNKKNEGPFKGNVRKQDEKAAGGRIFV